MKYIVEKKYQVTIWRVNRVIDFGAISVIFENKIVLHLTYVFASKHLLISLSFLNSFTCLTRWDSLNKWWQYVLAAFGLVLHLFCMFCNHFWVLSLFTIGRGLFIIVIFSMHFDSFLHHFKSVLYVCDYNLTLKSIYKNSAKVWELYFIYFSCFEFFFVMILMYCMHGGNSDCYAFVFLYLSHLLFFLHV